MHAAEDEGLELVDDLHVGERLAVDLGVDEHPEGVGGELARPMPLQLLGEVALDLEPLRADVRARGAKHHRAVDRPAPELLGCVRRQPEDLRHDDARDRHGVALVRVGGTVGDECVVHE